MSENRGGQAGDNMSFWSHLDALRVVLVRIGIVVAMFAVVLFIAMPWLFDNVILAPCSGKFPLYKMFDYISGGGSLLPDLSSKGFHVDLINIKLASQFFIHLSTSCWMAVVLSFPIIIYIMWGFVSPALYENEKRGIKRAFFFGNIMFYVGVSVGYFLVFPLTLRFLADYQLSESIPNTISIDSYMDNFLTIVLLMGVVFELPLLAWLLGKMGFLKRSFFSRYRRHAIVALLIVAALITPTGDPFTLFIVFFPIYGLWEFSSRLVKA